MGQVRYAGARGQLTVQADLGFYTHAIVAVCRKMDVATPSPSASTSACGISSRPYPRLTGRRYPTCICHRVGPGKTSSVAPWHDSERCLSRPDGARPPPTQPPRQLTPGRSASASCRVLSRHLAHHSHCRPPSAPPIAPADRLPTSNPPEFESGPSRLLLLHPPSAILAPSIGGFGFTKAGTLGNIRLHRVATLSHQASRRMSHRYGRASH